MPQCRHIARGYFEFGVEQGAVDIHGEEAEGQGHGTYNFTLVTEWNTMRMRLKIQPRVISMC